MGRGPKSAEVRAKFFTAERHGRYLLVLALPDARSSSVVAALVTAFKELPQGMARTLTWDRGME